MTGLPRDLEDERRHRKQRLAAAFRIFGAFGFDEARLRLAQEEEAAARGAARTAREEAAQARDALRDAGSMDDNPALQHALACAEAACEHLKYCEIQEARTLLTAARGQLVLAHERV